MAKRYLRFKLVSSRIPASITSPRRFAHHDRQLVKKKYDPGARKHVESASPRDQVIPHLPTI